MKNKLKTIIIASSFIVSAAHAGGIIVCEPTGSDSYLCDAHVSGVAPHNATYQWFGTGGISVQGNQDSALVNCDSTSGTINVNVTANGTTTQVSRGLSCDSSGWEGEEGERVFGSGRT